METLGSVTVICSDKTGTLTRNEMTVQAVATRHRLYSVSGVGYDPHGGFSSDGRDEAPGDHPVLQELCLASVLCNDARLVAHNGQWRVEGDPMEGALLVLGRKAGLDPELLVEELPRDDIIPFESEHRFMATLHHDHEGRGVVFVKGAPEKILGMCRAQRAGSPCATRAPWPSWRTIRSRPARAGTSRTWPSRPRRATPKARWPGRRSMSSRMSHLPLRAHCFPERK